jgi:uncharacterized membrane protein YccC
VISDKAKNSFKLSLAMVITYAVALSQGWGTPFWAGFAVTFCGLTTVGDSLNKGLLRVFGTLFGAAAGLALLAMFPQDRWSFMTAMSIFIAFCTYMMGGTTRWYFWFMAAITVPIVTVTAEPDAIYNFNRAILRSQQTTLGIVVYSLVSVLIWPVSSRGAFDGAVRKVIGNQRRLFTHYMAHLLGAPDDKSSVQLRIEATRTLGGLGALLDHAELDTLEIWEVRRQWRGFVAQMTGLQDTMECWRQMFQELEEINAQRFIKALPEIDAEVGNRFAAIEGMLDDQAPALQPTEVALEVDRTHLSELSHFQRSAVLLAVSYLTRIEQETRTLFDSIRYIRGFTSPNDPKPVVDAAAARAPLDPDRFAGVLRVTAVLWLNLLLYIYVPDLPVASALVILGTVIVMLQFLHPQASSKVFLRPLMFGLVVGSVAYIFIMPHLSGYLELGTMIFAFIFGLTYILHSPRQIPFKFMGVALFMVTTSIDVHQHYSFLTVANLAVFVLILVGSLLVGDHFPISFRAEDRFQAILNRFFRSCEFLLSTAECPWDRLPSRLQDWRTAFHLNEVALSPQKLAGWVHALPAAALGNTTPAQVQDLVTSLQAISYRMNALVQAQAASRSDSNIGQLVEAIRSWGAGVQKIFRRLAAGPGSGEYAGFQSQLDAKLARLEARIEGALEPADDRGASAEAGRNMYRLLGSYRGLSEALVNFIKQAAAIDWTRLREERF